MAAITVSSPKSAILQNPIPLREPSSSFLGGSLKGLCLQLKPRNKNRDATSLVVASAKPTTTESISSSRSGGDRFYINFTGFPFPLGPFLNRSTTRTEVSCFFVFSFKILNTSLVVSVRNALLFYNSGLWHDKLLSLSFP